jgi:hypothetical protein
MFKRHFQIAYIVDDIQAGTDHFRGHFGVANWDVMETSKLLPGLGARFTALAWTGDVMIELIEPDTSIESIYRGWLRERGTLLRFHHLGFLVDSDKEFASVKAGLARSGFPIESDGSFDEMLDFACADTTHTLGHYHEIIHLKSQGAAFFDSIPRN